MYTFDYQRPASTSAAAARRSQGRRPLPRRRPEPDPGHEAASVLSPNGLVDLGGVAELKGIKHRRQQRRDRRHDDARGRRTRSADGAEGDSRAGRTGRRHRRPDGAQPGHASAARSPTADPAACYPAAVLGLGATVVTNKRSDCGRQLLHRHVRNGAAAGRADHCGAASRLCHAEGGVHQVQAAGLALRARRRVRQRKTASAACASPSPGRSRQRVPRQSDRRRRWRSSFTADAAKAVKMSIAEVTSTATCTARPPTAHAMISVMAARAVAAA